MVALLASWPIDYPAMGFVRNWGNEGHQPGGSARPPTLRLVVCFRCCELFRCPSVESGRGQAVQSRASCSAQKKGAEIESLTVVLAIANAMASHAGLARPLLSVNKHGG